MGSGTSISPALLAAAQAARRAFYVIEPDDWERLEDVQRERWVHAADAAIAVSHDDAAQRAETAEAEVRALQHQLSQCERCPYGCDLSRVELARESD